MAETWLLNAALGGYATAAAAHRHARWALRALALALVLHTLSLAVRWQALGHGPFTTLHEILSSNLWSLALVFALAWAWRRELRPAWGAAAGVLLLLAQPDFLFYILRNSHERTTWTFGLLVLWLWVRSGRMYGLPALAAGVCTVYLLLWAMIANNAYLG